MQRRTMLTAAASAVMAVSLLGGCANYREQGDKPADIEHTIDSGADATLTALYAKVPGSAELAGKARGILVFPEVFDAGVVVGGEYGRGALRVGGRTIGYYKTSSVTLGVQVGAQSRALVLMFMNRRCWRSRMRRPPGNAPAAAPQCTHAGGNRSAIRCSSAMCDLQEQGIDARVVGCRAGRCSRDRRAFGSLRPKPIIDARCAAH